MDQQVVTIEESANAIAEASLEEKAKHLDSEAKRLDAVSEELQQREERIEAIVDEISKRDGHIILSSGKAEMEDGTKVTRLVSAVDLKGFGIVLNTLTITEVNKKIFVTETSNLVQGMFLDKTRDGVQILPVM